MNYNNYVSIVGEIASDFEYSHSCGKKDFYRFIVATERLSGAKDMVPVKVSNDFFDVSHNLKGMTVSVEGRFHSYNYIDKNGVGHLSLYVLPDKIDLDEYAEHENFIQLEGTICKEPRYRTTPKGSRISDVILAVNENKKSFYIPCIFWGSNAEYTTFLNVGNHIRLDGRIQSRTYNKRIGDKEYEERTCYEVSANLLEVCDDACNMEM